MVKEDEELLVTWLSNPLLLQFYEGRDRPHNLEMIREHFYKEDDTVRCIIEFEGKPIGYIQYYAVDDQSKTKFGYTNSDEKIFGTDQFIGEVDYWNKGIGKKLVASMVKYLITSKDADRVIMEPQAWNERAITCYEKCGFVKVQLLNNHEYHEGQFRDCWLIEYCKK